MSRKTKDILKDLCSYNPTEAAPADRLLNDFYRVLIGRLRSKKHVDLLHQIIEPQRTTSGEINDSNESEYVGISSEEPESILEYAVLEESYEQLQQQGKNDFVYEDKLISPMLDRLDTNPSYEKLKMICCKYVKSSSINVDNVMTEHEYRVSQSYSYFTKKNLPTNEAKALALSLSFYTGTPADARRSHDSLIARKPHLELIDSYAAIESNEAVIIFYYLVKALSYIPFYWGYVTRYVRLALCELNVYTPGSLITWIQFSSCFKGKKDVDSGCFKTRNTIFRIYSLTGRSIKQFSNYPEDDEVLFLPHSTFLVLNKISEPEKGRQVIYMRQVEPGFGRASVLWIDNDIFNPDGDIKRQMECVAANSFEKNVHFILKSSTESALSFLRSPFGQCLKTHDSFRIVIGMNSNGEILTNNLGSHLIKTLRQMGFRHPCMIFTSNSRAVKRILSFELDSKEYNNVMLTTEIDQLRSFISFDEELTYKQQSDLEHSMDSDNTQASGYSRTSEFYDACRENDVELVKKYLKRLSLKEINKMEPNGSTALHVAAYRGHEDIVQLLLKKGASCTIVNKYENTPLDEAKTNKIKQMIRRRMNKARFVSDQIEWILQTDKADYQAHQYWKKLEQYGQDPQFYQLIEFIKTNYLENDLKDVEDIDTIKQYFNKAILKRDPFYLLQAYTAETGFYSTLNIHLAKLHLENLTDKENLSRAYYIGIVARHPRFETLSHIGKVYRGMMITENDLKQYEIGTRILTKTFSSSSKQYDKALDFLSDNRRAMGKLSTICIYEIRNKRTALDIENISVFPDEEEVLVLPYSAFKIIDIKINRREEPNVEIQLKECEPW